MADVQAKVVRYLNTPNQTLGVWYNAVDLAKAYTLELPWRDNLRGKSCIPDGRYAVIKHMSPRFGQCFWLQNTFPRTQILVHAGNYNTDTAGCLLVGNAFADMNNDGEKDLKGSRETLAKLLRSLPRKFEMTITTESRFGTSAGFPRII